MHVRDLTRDQIRRFVYEGVADGASGTFINIASTMLDPDSTAKVHIFMDAARKVEQLLADGCPRDRLLGYL